MTLVTWGRARVDRSGGRGSREAMGMTTEAEQDEQETMQWAPWEWAVGWALVWSEWGRAPSPSAAHRLGGGVWGPYWLIMNSFSQKNPSCSWDSVSRISKAPRSKPCKKVENVMTIKSNPKRSIPLTWSTENTDWFLLHSLDQFGKESSWGPSEELSLDSSPRHPDSRGLGCSLELDDSEVLPRLRSPELERRVCHLLWILAEVTHLEGRSKARESSFFF